MSLEDLARGWTKGSYFSSGVASRTCLRTTSTPSFSLPLSLSLSRFATHLVSPSCFPSLSLFTGFHLSPLPHASPLSCFLCFCLIILFLFVCIPYLPAYLPACLPVFVCLSPLLFLSSASPFHSLALAYVTLCCIIDVFCLCVGVYFCALLFLGL